jgi:hypothetical protein
MRRDKQLSIFLALLFTVMPISAHAAGKSIQLKLDFTKAAEQKLACDGVSVPITYKLVSPIANATTVNIAIYNSGIYEQTIKIKSDANGVLKRSSGQEWYGTSGGNPTIHAWYAYPINSDPQELCSQLKSDVTFAKSRYTAYKSIVAIFILRTKK